MVQEIYDRRKELEELVADGDALFFGGSLVSMLLLLGGCGFGVLIGNKTVGFFLGLSLLIIYVKKYVWRADMIYIEGRGWIARWEWIRRPYSWEAEG